MKRTIGLGFVLVSLLAARALHAQKFSEWSPPQHLPAPVNSPYNDQHPAISRDGLSLYFSSDRPGGFGDLDIWVSQRASLDDPWEEPVNLGPNINTAGKDLGPNFSPDGHHLYFFRPGQCGGGDLFVSYRKDRRDDFGWEPAENLGCQINSPQNDAGPTFFADDETGTTVLYFTSLNRPGNVGDWDIYVSTLQSDGTFGPASLVYELSTPYRDTRTAIRRDGLEMYISSGRPGGKGSEDLWVSTRDDTRSLWGPPVNVPNINSPEFDGAPALSWDAQTLYFYSERPGGLGKRDLYYSTRTKLTGEGH